jgi:3-polyprenyl-4-hydroxybenzoate decarboxylase
LETSVVDTGFAEVFTTCTNVAMTACAALGVTITPNVPASATAPATINNLFARFMFFSLRKQGMIEASAVY